MSRKRVLSRSRLIEIAGTDIAERLIEAFGGHSIPRASDRVRERLERDRLLKAEIGRLTYRQAAEKYGVSQRHAKRIAAEP